MLCKLLSCYTAKLRQTETSGRLRAYMADFAWKLVNSIQSLPDFS